MKKGTFTGLLYREFYLERRSFILGAVMFVSFAAIGWLVLLSTQFGNLAKLFTELELPEEQTNNMRDTVFMMMKGLPSVMGLQFLFSAVDLAARDELAAWQRFARCSPVMPARRAAIKTVFMLIAAVCSFLLPLGYIAFIDALQGQVVSYDELAVLSVGVCAVCAAVTLGIVYIMLLHSTDKGMLALIATIAVPTWTFAFINGMDRHDEESDLAETLLQFCRSLFPFTPLILIAVLAAGFTAMYLIYKRREK